MLRSLVAAALPAGVVSKYHTWEQQRSLSPAGRAILREDRRGLPTSDMGPRRAIEVATAWISRAQDQSRTADGGVARDYSLIKGWATSYPETTGYIVPTLIAAEKLTGQAECLGRCKRMLDWLVNIQLSSGAFQGGRIDHKPVVPVTFNTGQILLGLAAGVHEFGEARYVESMHRAARFLRDTLDADGCWRRFATPYAKPGDKAYDAHVSWGLFEAARLAPNEGYGEAGLKQVRWALTRQLANGWFEDNCLSDTEAPLTHTIGYVLRGVIEAYRFSNEPEFLQAALRTAEALATRLDGIGRLAGRWDRNWRPASKFVCLTGTVQIATCWLLLASITGRQTYVEFAKKANSFVRRTVKVAGNADIVGGVKGSFPINGDYGRFEYLNWAAKFFIDANLLELALPDVRSH